MRQFTRPNRPLKPAEKIGILLLVLVCFFVALLNRMYLYVSILPILALLHFYPLLKKIVFSIIS